MLLNTNNNEQILVEEKFPRGRLETIRRINNGSSRTRSGWLGDECRKALDEKKAAYEKWIDRRTRAK